MAQFSYLKIQSNSSSLQFCAILEFPNLQVSNVSNHRVSGPNILNSRIRTVLSIFNKKIKNKIKNHNLWRCKPATNRKDGSVCGFPKFVTFRVWVPRFQKSNSDSDSGTGSGFEIFPKIRVLGSGLFSSLLKSIFLFFI